MEDGTFHVTLFTQVKGQPLKKKILSSHQDLFPHEAEPFLENAEEVLLNMIQFGKDSGFIDVSNFTTFILSLTDEKGSAVPEIYPRTSILRQVKN